MAKIHLKRQHNLGREAARERVEEVAKKLQQKLNAKWEWEGDSLHFERSGASGSVAVEDDFVEFNIKLGMLLSPMKGTIEGTLKEQVDKVLS